MAALLLSLLANLILLAAVGFTMIESAVLNRKIVEASPQASPETVATIFAQLAEPASVAEPAPPTERPFTRTSEDQTAPPEENSRFIGERSTRATSDRAPDATAPRLPSQAGMDPELREMETTQSRYQDGRLDATPGATSAPSSPPTPPAPDPTDAPNPSPMQESAALATSAEPGKDQVRSTPPPPDRLLEGPNPVDVQILKPSPNENEIRPTPEKRPAPDLAALPETSELKKTVRPPVPASSDPAFSGFQRKTAIVGSISRTGRSALDVEDTPLGRYQAAISRAVELEWQRNCVRHRDFITPGYLTVRFFVETSGKVRSVQFVGDMETGEVQKGFTLNSIRDAPIPAMPPALKKDYAKEPLELVFRFFF